MNNLTDGVFLPMFRYNLIKFLLIMAEREQPIPTAPAPTEGVDRQTRKSDDQVFVIGARTADLVRLLQRNPLFEIFVKRDDGSGSGRQLQLGLKNGQLHVNDLTALTRDEKRFRIAASCRSRVSVALNLMSAADERARATAVTTPASEVERPKVGTSPSPKAGQENAPTRPTIGVQREPLISSASESHESPRAVLQRALVTALKGANLVTPEGEEFTPNGIYFPIKCSPRTVLPIVDAAVTLFGKVERKENLRLPPSRDGSHRVIGNGNDQIGPIFLAALAQSGNAQLQKAIGSDASIQALAIDQTGLTIYVVTNAGAVFPDEQESTRDRRNPLGPLPADRIAPPIPKQQVIPAPFTPDQIEALSYLASGQDAQGGSKNLPVIVVKHGGKGNRTGGGGGNQQGGSRKRNDI